MSLPAPLSTYLHHADGSSTVTAVRRRTTERASRTEDATLPLSGGAALKLAIHVAREQAGIATDMDLARRAGVSYDTLMNWYADRTVPRPERLKALADVLPSLSYGDLIGAYEGKPPAPVPLQDAIKELAGDIRALVGRLDLLLVQQATAAEEMMRALGVIGGRGPRGTPAADEPGARAGTD